MGSSKCLVLQHLCLRKALGCIGWAPLPHVTPKSPTRCPSTQTAQSEEEKKNHPGPTQSSFWLKNIKIRTLMNVLETQYDFLL